MGVDVVRWFLAFSTCGWNALSEQALHQRCQAVGRRRGKTRCVETACLQDSSGQGSTGGRGTTQWERQPCWKLTNICQEEIFCFQEFQVCEFCPWHICLFKALGLLCVCVCERQGQRKLREVKCGGRDNGPWNICECLTWRKPVHVCVWAHAHGHSVWKNKQLK